MCSLGCGEKERALDRTPRIIAGQADLDDIWRHIAIESGSERIADSIIDLITEKFLFLSDWPRVGRIRNDLRRGFRSFRAADYVIFYRITRASVVIQRVLHSRRDMARGFDG